jgi:hypothetical protein
MSLTNETNSFEWRYLSVRVFRDFSYLSGYGYITDSDSFRLKTITNSFWTSRPNEIISGTFTGDILPPRHQVHWEVNRGIISGNDGLTHFLQPTNQKLTKGGVLLKRKTSYLAR